MNSMILNTESPKNSPSTTISYDFEMDKNKLEPSHVKISFRSTKVSYTLTGFLAVCGGLLRLFLGISVLSIVEFIYFCTLRIFCTARCFKAENVIKPLERNTVDKSVIIDIGNKFPNNPKTA